MSSIILRGDTFHGISVVGRGVFKHEHGRWTYAGQHRDGHACGLGVTTYSDESREYADYGPDGQYDGRHLYRWAVGRTAPYTGSVGGVYTDVRPGYARVELRDRKAVRNHLASVHAVALVNLAEMTSGVALMTALPPGVRGIVTGLSIDYLKKARGTLVCTTTAQAPTHVSEPITHDVQADIVNADGDLVARCLVHWRLSPPDPARETAR